MTPIIVIPARLSSSRLPNKPLASIAGAPMIVRVLRCAEAAAIGPVLVACAEASIAEAVQAAGGHAVLTDPALPSGSDRVQAALAAFDPQRRYGVAVNLQGDLPTISPAQLRAVLTPLADAGCDLATLVTLIRDRSEAASASVVKAACSFAPDAATARAFWFSRQPIPWGEGPLWHHLGVYAWRRAALDRFVALPTTELERREGLEQLRALEAGMVIGCARVEEAVFGVDTPSDLERARRLFEAATA